MSETTVIKNRDFKTLTLVKTFDTPRRKVFEAFNNSKALDAWWGPQGWVTRSDHIDFTPGGSWRYSMECTDPNQTEWFGKISRGTAYYTSINQFEDFSYDDSFADEDGNIIPTLPTVHITMNFTDLGNEQTELICTTLIDTVEDYDTLIDMGIETGALESWDRLSQYLLSA